MMTQHAAAQADASTAIAGAPSPACQPPEPGRLDFIATPADIENGASFGVNTMQDKDNSSNSGPEGELSDKLSLEEISREKLLLSASPLAFNRVDAERFYRAVFLGQNHLDGLVELVFEGPDGRLTGKARYRVEDVDGVMAKCEALTRQRKRIYIGAGVRRPDMQPHETSTNADIIGWPALVFDFDNKEDAEWGLARAKELGLGFHFVVQTGAIRQGSR